MDFHTPRLTVEFGNEFIETLGAWKEAVVREGIKERLKKLIEKDLKDLEAKK